MHCSDWDLGILHFDKVEITHAGSSDLEIWKKHISLIELLYMYVPTMVLFVLLKLQCISCAMSLIQFTNFGIYKNYTLCFNNASSLLEMFRH